MNNLDLLIGILLVLAAIILYYRLLRPKSFFKAAPDTEGAGEPAGTPAKKLWYFPSFSSPQVQAELKLMKDKHRHKVKEKEHLELLTELGLDLLPRLASRDFQKLTRLIQLSQTDRVRKNLSTGEKKAFEKLKKIVGEEKRKTQPAEKKAKAKAALTKKERDYLFAVLKRISEKMG